MIWILILYSFFFERLLREEQPESANEIILIAFRIFKRDPTCIQKVTFHDQTIGELPLKLIGLSRYIQLLT